MKREQGVGREYAEIWGEAVQANRRLRTIADLPCSASCVLGRPGPPPARGRRAASSPIVVRVDEVGRAEALAYEAATAQADPLDPTTKYFLNRFVADFHSRRRATAEEHWTRSLRFLSTELANAAFAQRRRTRSPPCVASGTADTERPGRAGRAPHPPLARAAARRDRRLRSPASEGRTGGPARALVPLAPVRVPGLASRRSSSSTTPWASSSPTSRPTGRS